MGRALCVVASVAAFSSISASAEVNAWINPGSGAWDDASSWSLGVLPGNSQSVLLTNSGWKAVAINPSTPVYFPDAMTVNDLTICGAWDTENVLLLNYFGTAVPLTVLNGLTVADNAQIVNLNSSLVVQSGTTTVTNSQIIQDGGLVQITNGPFYLQRAEYDLTNGVFEGGVVGLGFPIFASFNQYGGSVMITNLAFGQSLYPGAGGSYALYGGYLSLPNGLALISDGNSAAGYFQAGGTNQTTHVYLEEGGAQITLNGGVLADTDVNVVSGRYGRASIQQNGGTHVITNGLNIAGGAANGYTVVPATYTLNGGTLSAGLIELGADQGDSVFVQSNGTAIAETFYAHSLGFFGSHNTIVTLAGATLSCSNYTTVDGGGTLNQSGGALLISSLLDFGGSRDLGAGHTIYGRYTFTGGTLTASNINITGDFRHRRFQRGEPDQQSWLFQPVTHAADQQCDRTARALPPGEQRDDRSGRQRQPLELRQQQQRNLGRRRNAHDFRLEWKSFRRRRRVVEIRDRPVRAHARPTEPAPV